MNYEIRAFRYQAGDFIDVIAFISIPLYPNFIIYTYEKPDSALCDSTFDKLQSTGKTECP
jgi:hypothetical protein